MFDVNKYLAANPEQVRSAIRTKRGRLFSVQASAGHYCTPRDNFGPYVSVEVMVCEGSHPRPFIGNGGRSTDGIYGWVPVTVVERIINQIDGGVVGYE